MNVWNEYAKHFNIIINYLSTCLSHNLTLSWTLHLRLNLFIQIYVTRLSTDVNQPDCWFVLDGPLKWSATRSEMLGERERERERGEMQRQHLISEEVCVGRGQWPPSRRQEQLFQPHYTEHIWLDLSWHWITLKTVSAHVRLDAKVLTLIHKITPHS